MIIIFTYTMGGIHLREAVNIIFMILQFIIFVFGLYYFTTSIFGLAEKIFNKPGKPHMSEKKFAIFVPAHNEGVVIDNIIHNLDKLNYPKDLYDVFVIADNCTDDTAEVAREAGATVLERFNKKETGKGFALQWAFGEILYKENNDYDVAVIFDADNLVNKSFLKEMNNKLCDGHKVIQGYIDSKNPNDSWITASYSMAFWSANRLFQSARYYLGLSCEIGGTGFCMDVNVLKEIGWDATSLVEDLEFTMKLNMAGHRVAWANEAVIYDEKPLTLAASWNQRRRWMQGFADVCSRYFFKLIIMGIKKREMALIDCAIYTLQPFILVLGGLILVMPAINAVAFDGEMFLLTSNVAPDFFIVYGIVQLLMLPISLFYDKKFSYRMFLFYPIYLMYCLTWIPIAAQGIFMMKQREWSHTVHTRRVTIQEIQEIE